MPIISADKFNYFLPQGSVSNVPNQTPNPASPTFSSEAETGGARMMLVVGDELEKMGKALRAAQVKDDTQRHTLSAMQELSDAEREVAQDGDYRTMPQRFRARMEEIRKGHENLIAGDPEVATAFKEKFGILSQGHADRVQLQSWRRELDRQQANAITTADKTMRLIGNSNNPNEISLYRQMFMQDLDDKVQDGLLDASWAATFKIAWDKQMAMTEVRKTMQLYPAEVYKKLQTPDGADAIIYGQKLEPDDPRRLGEDARLVLLREAHSTMRAMQMEEKAGLETAVYQQLHDRFEGNADMMRNALMNPAEQKGYGITLENVKSIESAITDLEKKKNSDMRQVQVNYLRELVAGRLTEAQIVRDVSAGLITPPVGEHWIESVQKRHDRVDPVRQAMEIATVNGLISRGTDPDTVRDYVLSSKDLKKEDKEQQLNKLDAKLTRDMEEGRKLAYEEIKTLIIPKRGLLGTLLPTPSESVAVSKAQMALDDWIDQQVKENNNPSRKEVRLKGIEFGESYQVALHERVAETEEAGIKAAKELELAAKLKIEKEKREKAAKAAERSGPPVGGLPTDRMKVQQ